MNADFGRAFDFTDFRGLAALRHEAGQNTPEARRAVARQFEALFLDQVLRSMRASVAIEGGEGEGTRFYRELYDRQLALALSEGRGVGLAEAILGELDGRPTPPAPALEAIGRRPELAPRRSGPAAAVLAEARSDAPQLDVPRSRAGFVAALAPHARRAAATLGVTPEVLIAQAALETGWGRHVIRDGSGRPTFNVFGVKAGSGWPGRRVSVPTLELVNGVAERRTEPFRAYGSLAEAFDDYVALVGGLPRYRAAVAARNPAEYVQGLASGGYSTDPRYAEKVLAIARSLAAGAQEAAESVDKNSRLQATAPHAPAGDEA